MVNIVYCRTESCDMAVGNILHSLSRNFCTSGCCLMREEKGRDYRDRK